MMRATNLWVIAPWALAACTAESGVTTTPVEDLAVLRVSEEGATWGVEALALLSLRNWQSSIPVEGSQHPFRLRQPWVTPDHFQIDHLNGSVLVGRSRTINPGVLELIEISVAGDTLWTRSIQLPPIPLRADQVEAELEQTAAMIAELSGDAAASPLLKSRIREAWIIPEHWPAVRETLLMSNGEIWFEPQGQDTPGVWYAVRKGAEQGPIRRVTVPESFQPRDVNATHVWGLRRDELDVGYVTGLLLVRGSGIGTQ